jgi:Rrf2 family protein
VIVNQTAEYALRATAALTRAGGALTAHELSERASVPVHYLATVMRPLVVAGLVDARRGRGGGFRLARAPEAISFREIIDAVNGWPDPERCAYGQARCNASRPCPLHPTWTNLHDAMSAWAVTTTLADTRDQSATTPPARANRA